MARKALVDLILVIFGVLIVQFDAETTTTGQNPMGNARCGLRAASFLLRTRLHASLQALIMCLELHRHPDQLGKIASADALHHPSPMTLDCSGTNVEFDCDFLA